MSFGFLLCHVSFSLYINSWNKMAAGALAMTEAIERTEACKKSAPFPVEKT
jgi:hypothetical protein